MMPILLMIATLVGLGFVAFAKSVQFIEIGAVITAVGGCALVVYMVLHGEG